MWLNFKHLCLLFREGGNKGGRWQENCILYRTVRDLEFFSACERQRRGWLWYCQVLLCLLWRTEKSDCSLGPGSEERLLIFIYGDNVPCFLQSILKTFYWFLKDKVEKSELGIMAIRKICCMLKKFIQRIFLNKLSHSNSEAELNKWRGLISSRKRLSVLYFLNQFYLTLFLYSKLLIKT